MAESRDESWELSRSAQGSKGAGEQGRMRTRLIDRKEWRRVVEMRLTSEGRTGSARGECRSAATGSQAEQAVVNFF